MSNPVPTLSPSGWVTAPADKADKLFSHFFLSDKAQTVLYPGNVANLQEIIKRNGHDLVNLAQDMRNTLTIYLSRYFDTAIVDVTTDDAATAPNGEVTITVYCNVTDNGVSYSFGALVKKNGSTVSKIINLISNKEYAL